MIECFGVVDGTHQSRRTKSRHHSSASTAFSLIVIISPIQLFHESKRMLSFIGFLKNERICSPFRLLLSYGLLLSTLRNSRDHNSAFIFIKGDSSVAMNLRRNNAGGLQGSQHTSVRDLSRDIEWERYILVQRRRHLSSVTDSQEDTDITENPRKLYTPITIEEVNEICLIDPTDPTCTQANAQTSRQLPTLRPTQDDCYGNHALGSYKKYCGSAMPSAADSSEAPSTFPTQEPSMTPTLSPTQRPSQTPSTEPSGEPSSLPSQAPSQSPSTHPTAQPTQTPSTTPSYVPSYTPSQYPTASPSVHPSGIPTTSPSSFPTPDTESPTSRPTTSAMSPISGTDCNRNEDCNGGAGFVCVEGFCLRQGALRFTLVWTGNDDIDLWVYPPNDGPRIFYVEMYDPVSGGELDVDRIPAFFSTRTNVENVYFPNSAPSGTYRVCIDNFNQIGISESFELFVYEGDNLMATISDRFSANGPGREWIPNACYNYDFVNTHNDN